MIHETVCPAPGERVIQLKNSSGVQKRWLAYRRHRRENGRVPRFRLTTRLPLEIVDRLGQTWAVEFRPQECSDRFLMCLRRAGCVGERWIHLFPCWETRQAQRMLFETGVEIATGIAARVFESLAKDGRAETLA